MENKETNYKLCRENKYTKISKIFKDIVVPVVLVVALVGTIFASLIFKKKREIREFNLNLAKITGFYGENSIEANLIRYLDLSTRIDNLNIDKYISDEVSGDKIKLASPEIIESTIEEFKTLKQYNGIDLNKDLNFINKVAFLQAQKALIDGYVDDRQMIVYNDLSDSLSEYISEKYDIPDKVNIYAYNGTRNGIVDYRVCYCSSECNDNTKEIRSGVDAIDNFSRFNEGNHSKQDKLQSYMKYLLEAKTLYDAVSQNNLYDEKAEKNLKR